MAVLHIADGDAREVVAHLLNKIAGLLSRSLIGITRTRVYIR